MKTILKISLILTLLLITFSCEKIEEFSDVKFNTTLNNRIDLRVTPTKSETIHFSGEKLVKLEEGSGDIAKYLNYIKEIDVNNFSYKFINYSGPEDAVVTANLYVDGILVKENVNLILSENVSAATIFKVIDNVDLQAIATRLKNNKQITISYEGDVTTNEALSFKVDVSLGVGITADPI